MLNNQIKFLLIVFLVLNYWLLHLYILRDLLLNQDIFLFLCDDDDDDLLAFKEGISNYSEAK